MIKSIHWDCFREIFKLKVDEHEDCNIISKTTKKYVKGDKISFRKFTTNFGDYLWLRLSLIAGLCENTNYPHRIRMSCSPAVYHI